jgi:glycosyltransferase involved in cell wall biosynthesis
MKKKILVISVGIWPPAVKMAGTAAIYHLLTELAKKKGLEIHVLTALPSWADRNIEQWAARQKAEHNLSFHFVRADSLLRMRALFFAQAIKLCRRYRFDLIHDYSSAPILIGLTRLLGKVCRGKTIHTLCAANNSRLGFWPPRFLIKNVDAVTITSPTLLKKTGGNQQATYLPLGINVEKFSPTGKLTDRSSILFLGSLDDRKGAFVLAHAVKNVLKRHPGAKFIFASFGTEGRDPHYQKNKEKLQNELKDHASAVEIRTGKEDVSNLMRRAAIFVLPAASLHGTLVPPITLIEAMSMGKPCVVSDICRGDGLVGDQINCLLFRSGDANDLTAKINSLLGNSTLREKLSRNARQKVVERFDINKVAEKLLELYREILR